MSQRDANRLKWIVLALLALGILVVVAGCSKSNAWILDEAKQRGLIEPSKVSIDTTIIVRGDTIERITQLPGIHDTLYVDKPGGPVVKIVRLPGEKVFVNAQCPPDTVYLRVDVPVEKITNLGKVSLWWSAIPWWLRWSGGVALGLLLAAWARRIFKK